MSAGMTALKQKHNEVLLSALLPLGGMSKVSISPTTQCLQTTEEEIAHFEHLHAAVQIILPFCVTSIQFDTISTKHIVNCLIINVH